MQSDAKRRHSKSCFRDFSDSDTMRLLNRLRNDCTASHVLSVVYATEKSKNSVGRAHIQTPAYWIGERPPFFWGGCLFMSKHGRNVGD